MVSFVCRGPGYDRRLSWSPIHGGTTATQPSGSLVDPRMHEPGTGARQPQSANSQNGKDEI
jgi:hypothetical protein